MPGMNTSQGCQCGYLNKCTLMQAPQCSRSRYITFQKRIYKFSTALHRNSMYSSLKQDYIIRTIQMFVTIDEKLTKLSRGKRGQRTLQAERRLIILLAQYHYQLYERNCKSERRISRTLEASSTENLSDYLLVRLCQIYKCHVDFDTLVSTGYQINHSIFSKGGFRLHL